MHSQARLAIGFLLVLSKWCEQSQLEIGFQRCFVLQNPKLSFPWTLQQGPSLPKVFSEKLTIIFLNNLGHINSKLWICNKKFKKLFVKELCSSRKWKPCFSCCMCVCMSKWIGEGGGLQGRRNTQSRVQWFATNFAESSCFMWRQPHIRPKNDKIAKKMFSLQWSLSYFDVVFVEKQFFA